MNDNKYEKVAIEAALESGFLIKNSVGKIARISHKGRDNIVTDVDKKSEKLIIRKILSKFKDHSILSEETPPRHGSSGYRWIIDPLDGTTNFAHAFPFFCVSIALELDGEVILGVIYDPMRDELFRARRGSGAWLNDKRIAVSKVRSLSESFLSTGFSYGVRRRDKNIKHFNRFLRKTLAIRRPGAAALDLCYVACGRLDGFWELYLNPWDSAAGMLIVQEAGGKVTKFDGSRYSPDDKEILATNAHIHRQMVSNLSR